MRKPVTKPDVVPAERKKANVVEEISDANEELFNQVTAANNMAVRVLYYHVHIEGAYPLSIPNKVDALAYIKKLVHKHNPDEEPEIHYGREAISYFGETDGIKFIQAMILPPHLSHLIPAKPVTRTPCAGEGCMKAVAPRLDEECSTIGCRNLLCENCLNKASALCAKHASD